jgi:hypothetical protein
MANTDSILSNPRKFLRIPLDEIDDDKIIVYDIETDHQ